MSEEFCDDYVRGGDAEEESSRALQIFSLTLLTFTVLTVILSYLYFYVNYKKYVFTKARNIYILTCLAIGLLVVTINFCLQAYIGSINFSCRAFSLLSGLQVILNLQSAWVRMFSLLWRIDYNRLLINQTYLAFTNGDLNQNPGSIQFVQLRTSKEGKQPSYYASVLENEGTNSFLAGNKPIIQNRCFYRYGSLKEKLFAFLLFDVFHLRIAENYPMNIRIAGVFASPRFASVLYTLIVIFTAVVLVCVEFSFLPFGTDCFNCQFSPALFAVQGIIGITFFFIVYALIKLIKVYDSFGIRKELLVVGVSYLTTRGIVYIGRAIGRDLEKDGQFNFNLVVVVYSALTALYVFPYQVWLAKRIAKGNVVIEEDEDLLKKVLDSVEGRQAFALYLACSLSLENLFFYDAATKWKQAYSSLERNIQQTTAEEVYAQFLGQEALLLINISDGCKTKITEELKSGLNEETFDEAVATVWAHMTTDIFPRFKKTAYFKASRNELQEV